MSEDLLATMGALTQTAGVEESGAALAAFRNLQAVTVSPLDNEEAEIEGVYLAKRDTAEMKAMGKAFARVSPARGGRFFAWLLDGASPEEHKAVTRDVPAR